MNKRITRAAGFVVGVANGALDWTIEELERLDVRLVRRTRRRLGVEDEVRRLEAALELVLEKLRRSGVADVKLGTPLPKPLDLYRVASEIGSVARHALEGCPVADLDNLDNLEGFVRPLLTYTPGDSRSTEISDDDEVLLEALERWKSSAWPSLRNAVANVTLEDIRAGRLAEIVKCNPPIIAESVLLSFVAEVADERRGEGERAFVQSATSGESGKVVDLRSGPRSAGEGAPC